MTAQDTSLSNPDYQQGYEEGWEQAAFQIDQAFEKVRRFGLEIEAQECAESADADDPVEFERGFVAGFHDAERQAVNSARCTTRRSSGMGYDLTWAEDPYEGERLAVIKAVSGAQPVEADVYTFNAYISAAFRAAEAIGGYLRTSIALMDSLIAEMADQGMFRDNETMREKLERQTGTITPEEIEQALDSPDFDYRPSYPPKVVVSPVDQMMARFALNAGMGSLSGAQAMIEMPPAGWMRDWIRWIIFMISAHEHGGIVVR